MLEETGYRPVIAGHLAEGFGGTGSMNFYFLMIHRPTASVGTYHWETASLRWADESEARRLIGRTTNMGGRSATLRR